MFIDILFKDETMISLNNFMSFDYKQNSSIEDITIGNFSISSLSFSVWNGEKELDTFKFKGSRVYLYRDLERTKKVGEFTIEQVTKDRSLLKFECYDDVDKFDKEIFKGIQTPFTINSLIVQIVEGQLGLKLKNSESDFSHLKQIYDNTDAILGKKTRDILKWCAELACKYIVLTEDNEVYFGWYDLNTIKKEIPPSKMRNYKRDEEEVKIGAISCILENEEYIIGDKGEGYDLRLTTDNPLLKPLSSSDRYAILQDIYNKTYGMQWLSCDIEISTDELDGVNIGDTLKLVDPEDGEEYKILFTYQNISNIHLTKFQSAGENPDRSVKSSEGGSSSGTSQGEKVYITKNENWQSIRLENYHGETFLNDITVSGVNEKSSIFLSYSVNFSSTFENIILFRLYVNDMLSKTFYFTPTAGDNIFTWSESANINLDSDINVFKITLDTSTSTLDNFIYIEKGMSSLSVVTVGAKSAGSASVNALEFKETVKPIKLVNPESNLLLVNFIDELIVDNKEYINNVVSEKVDLINFKEKTKLTIQ